MSLLMTMSPLPGQLPDAAYVVGHVQTAKMALMIVLKRNVTLALFIMPILCFQLVPCSRDNVRREFYSSRECMMCNFFRYVKGERGSYAAFLP